MRNCPPRAKWSPKCYNGVNTKMFTTNNDNTKPRNCAAWCRETPRRQRETRISKQPNNRTNTHILIFNNRTNTQTIEQSNKYPTPNNRTNTQTSKRRTTRPLESSFKLQTQKQTSAARCSPKATWINCTCLQNKPKRKPQEPNLMHKRTARLAAGGLPRDALLYLFLFTCCVYPPLVLPQ